jgi:ribonuclease HI
MKNAVPIEIHIDGSGARPDGKGSGFAWIQPQSGKSEVIQKDHLTNNQAEYNALLAALVALPAKSTALIWTDSQIVSEQFNGRYQVHDSVLRELLTDIKRLIRRNSLNVSVKWIPRRANLADGLLKRGLQRNVRELSL